MNARVPSPLVFALAPLIRAALLGGVVAGTLDAADGVVAYYLHDGLNPIQVLQFIASGAFGDSAFKGGLLTAGAGMLFHYIIAIVAAGVFVLGASRMRVLARAWVVSGLAYGVWVWAFMNFLVLPMSKVAPAPFSLAMTVNGVVGHAVFVGLPIALFARRAIIDCPQSRLGSPAPAGSKTAA